MKLLTKRVLWTVLLLGGLAAGQGPGGKKAVSHVLVEEATSGRDKIVRKSIGHTEAIRMVNIRAAVEGFLSEVHFEEGSLVQEGQVLMQINPIRYEAALRKAEAAVAQLDARLVYSTNRYKRLARLLKEQAASVEDTETAHATVETLKAERAQAEAELIRARKDLDDCTIRAEITGRIGRLQLSAGNYVTRGEELATITQLDPIYVRFPLSQTDVNTIFRGPKEIGNVASVRMVTATGRSYPSLGKIAIVDNLLTGSTDTYTLWAQFDNKEHVLTHRGISALHVSLMDTAEVTMVPLTAVHYDTNGAFVNVLDAQNTVSRREVITGSIQGRMQTIYDGLQPGEVVITDGAHKTRPGAQVVPVFPKDVAVKPRQAAAPEQEAAPTVVRTAEVCPIVDPTVLTSQGARLEAINRIELRPLVQGILEEPKFAEGARVEQGDVLFRIDSTRYEATVKACKAGIAQLEIKIKDARKKYERQKTLVELNASSKDEMESAKATLDELLAAKGSAEAALTVAEDDLSRCTVRAGVSGRIGRSHFSKGNYITDVKSPLATLVQLSPIYVRFPISESSILGMFGNAERMMREAEITLETASGKNFPEKGQVSFCDNVMQPNTATQNVWAIFRNEDKNLTPGGVVTIRVQRKPEFRIPAVPAEAVLTDTRGRYVFVLKNGRAMRRDVLCGSTDAEGRTAVFAGLENGMQVIINNLATLEDGAPVQAE